MQIIYLLFLILKAYKFVEGGVIKTNGFKYEPGLYLNSKGQSKDVSSARIISEDPFIISLETRDKEIEPNRRKKLPKKRNRTKRETGGVMEKLERSKRCHHHHRKRLAQGKRELRALGKNTESKNDDSFHPGMVAEQLDIADAYEKNKNSTPECVIQISDDQTLNDLIEEIRRLKVKLKDLLIYVANGTASSEKITSSEAENRNGNEKSLEEITAFDDDEYLGGEDHPEDQKNLEKNKDSEDKENDKGSSHTERKDVENRNDLEGLDNTSHNDQEDLEDHKDVGGLEELDHGDPEDHDNTGHNDNEDHEELHHGDPGDQDNTGHNDNEDHEDLHHGDTEDQDNTGHNDNEDHEDLDDEEAFADDKSILQNKIDFLSSLIDEPFNDTEKGSIPDDVIQKWKDSPVLNLLYIPEKNPYTYQLLDDSETEEELKHPSDDRKLLEDKIKYLQSILESDDVKSRKKRDIDDESPCKMKKRRCARERVSSSQNRERYQSKKWMDDLKLKRSRSKSCPCSACNKEKAEEADSFEMSEEMPYAEDFMSNDRLLKWSKKSADSDPFMDDLEVYRERAKQILKNAQEILRRIKETEEKMKNDEDYLESDWEGGGYAVDKNKRVNDNDVEDLVLELVKKVGKRLQEKKKRLQDSEESLESAEDENENSESNNRTDEFPELSELEKIVLKKAEEKQSPKPKDEVLEEIQNLVQTTPDLTSTTVSPFLNLLKGTDVMKDHRDQPPEEKSSTDPTPTSGPVKLPDNIPEPNDNLEASKLGIESTSSVEKLMDDFQDGKLDKNDMKTIQNLDDKKVDTLIDEIDEAEEEGCEEELPECQTTCNCADKSDDVDKYEIMKSFLLWIKEMHLYNVLDNYPKMQNN